MTEKRKAYIDTWGCQMNYHRSEGITGILNSHGYSLVESPSKADLILFNTCAVRGRSEEKVRGRLGQIEAERKPDSILGIGGCMAQHMGSNLLGDMKGVDFVFGTSNLSRIPEFAAAAREENNLAATPPPEGFEHLTYSRESDYFAWVTIAEGCSNNCSYCIVPRVRGPLRSRGTNEVLNEVHQLVDREYKEIQLLGQNVNAYGKDRPDQKDSFSTLLEKVAQTGIPRLSFTTPNPADLEMKTLDIMNDNSNIVRHLHLPLQSGSNHVLDLMNRDYTREEYLHIVDLARDQDPFINITTDVIVGHPGESEEDFQETLEIINEVKFGSVYAAKFSPRPGTPSAKIDNQVKEQVKQQRLEKILTTQKETNIAENERFIGEIQKVLIEGKARSNGKVYGKNEFKRTVLLPGGEELVGQFVDTRIEEGDRGTLYGKMEEQQQ